MADADRRGLITARPASGASGEACRTGKDGERAARKAAGGGR